MPTDIQPTQNTPPNNDLEIQRDNHQFEIAKLNIQANTANNQMWVDHWKSMRRTTYIFVGVIICIVLLFCLAAMYMGHSEIAGKVIGAAVFFLAGGGSGYALGTRQKPPHQ